tara:strand:- start:118 stop:564 length:447 start_codon:yes stop_codon:yes gene_type:complete
MGIYIGVKQIKAQVMNRLDYNKYRGWELPSDENGEDEGYLVEYLNSSTSNHPNHEGYVSWSPKKELDDAYISIQDVEPGAMMGKLIAPHEDRVISEYEALLSKCEKLNEFFVSDIYKVLTPDEQELLNKQYNAMICYKSILAARIEKI